MHKPDYKKFLDKAAQLCSRQEKCISDIRAKLSNWGVSADDSEKIISWLVNEKFIDELRFATAFAKDKFRYAKWGKIKIRYQLKAKRISENNIADAFEEIDDDEYYQMLADEICKKNRSTKEPDHYKRKAKLMRFAASRGYEMDLVNTVFDEMHQEES